MKRELNGVKARLSGIESELRDTKSALRRVAAAVTGVGAVLSGFREYAEEKLVTSDEFHGRMDAFVRQQDEMRLDWGQHQVRLDSHDKRLTRLEKSGT
ncbi:MAG: hypothetical protein HY403_07665 [Elusimicrobia bacterium]|nr:hypothetical protein [Elusimicrobiota bacterium]